jgi:hypothetical protein
MGRKKQFSTTEIAREPSLLYKELPFDVTRNGRIIATVSKPGGIWRECEKCGENTKNIIEYKDPQSRWQEIILCDKCSEELL